MLKHSLDFPDCYKLIHSNKRIETLAGKVIGGKEIHQQKVNTINKKKGVWNKIDFEEGTGGEQKDEKKIIKYPEIK